MELTPGIIMTVMGAAAFILLFLFWIVYLIISGRKMKKILNENRKGGSK